ncbi:thioredoxin [Leptolyngbya sp. Heron Island J]|uniref:DsbA family oxidoreductase n=1 Tax=Leptolyngbya sp. Heron Island J TaxID=1385935 RepID=UPI0003B9F7F5|nr:DsbA family oxidoreductase [Leptolyngbya sp. Heron Island J]ESA34111.1 thioredoxin [Leptolyngbya sp. Heron Island J]
MKTTVKIDFISDIVCPWCIIGYKRLEKAMQMVEDTVTFELHWHPFELNPAMPQDGENLREHLAKKYGTTLEGSIAARQRLTDMGAELGFTFNYYDEMRMYNTFKAHQLLHWAKKYDKQTDLHLKLFAAYFSEQQAVDDTEVLLAATTQIGLDSHKARAVLDSAQYAKDVKSIEAAWMSRGVQAVPAVIFNEQYLISGAQPTAVFKAQIEELAMATT